MTRRLLAAVLAAAMMLAASPAAAEPDGTRAIWEAALAEMRAGRPRAAIPLLEGLVTAAPEAQPVRLELALAHFRAGDDTKARYHFTRALAGPLSEGEREAARRHLAALENRSAWSGGFGLAFVPQSNAGRRTGTETVRIGGLDFVLNETAEPGTGLALSARVAWRPRLSRDLEGRFALRFAGTLYEDRRLNDQTLRGEAGLLHHLDDRLALGGGLTAAQRWLGKPRYSRDLGAFARLVLRPDDVTRLWLRTEALRRTSARTAALEGRIWRLTSAGERVLTPRLAVHASAFFTLTRALAPHESGRAAGATIGVTRIFDRGWRLGLDASLARDLREGPVPLFGRIRRDTDLRLVARVLNRRLQYRGIAPVVELGHERRRSTLPIHTFTNNYLSLGFERSF